jgi:hypothetical protein
MSGCSRDGAIVYENSCVFILSGRAEVCKLSALHVAQIIRSIRRARPAERGRKRAAARPGARVTSINS